MLQLVLTCLPYPPPTHPARAHISRTGCLQQASDPFCVTSSELCKSSRWSSELVANWIRCTAETPVVATSKVVEPSAHPLPIAFTGNVASSMLFPRDYDLGAYYRSQIDVSDEKGGGGGEWRRVVEEWEAANETAAPQPRVAALSIEIIHNIVDYEYAIVKQQDDSRESNNESGAHTPPDPENGGLGNGGVFAVRPSPNNGHENEHKSPTAPSRRPMAPAVPAVIGALGLALVVLAVLLLLLVARPEAEYTPDDYYARTVDWRDENRLLPSIRIKGIKDNDTTAEENWRLMTANEAVSKYSG